MFSPNSTIFKFLSGKTRLCCLCLKNIEEEVHFSLEDVVTLESENEEIFDLLTHVLGFQNTTNLPSETLCQDCLMSSIKCYNFIKMCKENIKYIENTVENLNVCCDFTLDDSDYYKTVYFTMNDATGVNQTYFDYKPAPETHMKAIKRFEFLSCPQKPTKKKLQLLNDSDDTFSDDNSEFWVEKKDYNSEKKSIKSGSIPIDVVLYDKDNPSLLKCKTCSKIFRRMHNLKSHYLRMHAPRHIPCDKCNKFFGSRTLLKQHKVEHHGTPFVCTQCGKTFPYKKALKTHEKSHKCRSCGKVIVFRKSRWGTHKQEIDSRVLNRTHCDNCAEYKCPQCNEIVYNKTTYLTHLKNCGKEKKPQYFCDHCNKGYLHKRGLQTHLTNDHGFGFFLSCKWCDKKFHAQSLLRNHEVKHTRVRNHTCEHCGQRFVTRPALTYHVRLHTGERPYPCEMCNESFVSASRRMEHKRKKHFGPTKQCPACPLKFFTNYQYKCHVRRHYNPESKLYCPDIEK